MNRVTADELPRFMACNPSPKMAASVPPTDDDTTARDEGIAAHYMAAQVFTGKAKFADLINTKAPNGFFMSQDMAEYAQDYLETAMIGTDACEIERDTSSSGQGYYIGARCDFVGMVGRTLRVVDFKYGWRIVSPDMNWTLIAHAIGYCAQTPASLPEAIEFCIFQPRPYHQEGVWRTWMISYERLCVLRECLIIALTTPSNQLNTSVHCAKCPAIATCPAARSAEMNAIDASAEMFNDTISNDQLSFMLDNLNRASKVIEERLDALQELAKHRLKAGAIINNYAVDISYGNRRFKTGVTPQMLLALTGKDFSTPKLVSPKEAERRGMDAAIVSVLTERPTTGVKLIRGSADKFVKNLMKG